MAGLYWSIGSLGMASAVTCDAYGYHSGKLTYLQKTRWKTAVDVQTANSLALLALSFKDSPYIHYAGVPLTFTTLLFSGGIYYTILTQKDENERNELVSALMPYGGVAMIASYVIMGFL